MISNLFDIFFSKRSDEITWILLEKKKVTTSQKRTATEIEKQKTSRRQGASDYIYNRGK
jgi:hypothetical protein